MALGVVALSFVACSSVLGLDDFARVDCVGDCASDGGGSAGSSHEGGSSSQAGTTGSSRSGSVGAGSSSSGGNGSAGSSTVAGGGTEPVEGGTSPGAGTSPSGGSGGSTSSGPCPGGPAPATAWKEHWYEHTEALSLRDYDDCVAVYVDPAMSATDSGWIFAFMSQAWLYNLTTYGKLGEQRLYVVLHQSKYVNGHVSVEYETTHDLRNVVDIGNASWTEGDYYRLPKLLSYIVEKTAVQGKRGSPGAAQWSSDGFSQIYSYDLFVGLGMTDDADDAFDRFEPTYFMFPVPNSYWFADFYYPVWRDHGKSKSLVNFFGLLEKYYPTTDQVMGPMNWGEYIHFSSGAARDDLQEQATYAFGWNDTWQGQIEQARVDFSGIEY